MITVLICKAAPTEMVSLHKKATLLVHLCFLSLSLNSQNKTLNAYHKEDLEILGKTDTDLMSDVQDLLTFREFNDCSMKNKVGYESVVSYKSQPCLILQIILDHELTCMSTWNKSRTSEK